MLKPLLIVRCVVLPTKAESHVPCPHWWMFAPHQSFNSVALLAHPSIHWISELLELVKGANLQIHNGSISMTQGNRASKKNPVWTPYQWYKKPGLEADQWLQEINTCGLKGNLPQDSPTFVLFVFILFCCLFWFWVFLLGLVLIWGKVASVEGGFRTGT